MNIAAPIKYRDNVIDIVRGLAIIIMVGANMAPILAPPHPLFFRLYSSMAAPIFITLAGMSVPLCLSTNNPCYTFVHFLKRGGTLLLAGVFVDIAAWGIWPFTTVDVLYLIGTSLPLAYLVAKSPTYIPSFLGLLILLVTPLLQYSMGYTSYPTEFYFDGSVSNIKDQTSILNHWIIDGWFPLFPWLGYVCIGVTLGKLRWPEKGKVTKFTSLKFSIITLITLILGSVLWYYMPGNLYEREGYSEMFYPVTYGFMLVSLSTVVALIIILDFSRNFVAFKPLEKFGKNSLFVYILHCIILGHVIDALFKSLPGMHYLLVYAGFIVVLFGSLYLWERWLFGSVRQEHI